MAYMKCPTLRLKIFHPLFLFFKFDKVIDFYFNTRMLANYSQKENISDFLKELLF